MSGHVQKFDRAEARRLRAEGLSYRRIGDQLGVTDMAIYFVINDEARAKQRAYNRQWQRERHRTSGSCPDCGKPVWGHMPIGSKMGGYTRTGRCRDCAARAKTTSVREDTLRCGECGEWKADENFPRQAAARARRGRHSLCRRCQTLARQRRRERSKLPCESCGAPALPPSEKGARCADRVLCLACYRSSEEFAASRVRAVAARKRKRAAA